MVDQSIAKRVSVRKYKGPLAEEEWCLVEQWLHELVPLDNCCNAQFHMVKDGEEVIKYFGGITDPYVRVECPHYVIITSEHKGSYLNNAGFMGEQLVLKMAEHNIGSCWLGGPLKKKEVKNIIHLDEHQHYVILIGFGAPEKELVPVYKRKRKPLSKMIWPLEPHDMDLGEALRLSPSAINGQPWYVDIKDDTWNFYHSNTMFVLKTIKSPLIHIDMGIALGNVVWQGEKEGKYCEIFKANNLARNKQYTASLKWLNDEECPQEDEG